MLLLAITLLQDLLACACCCSAVVSPASSTTAGRLWLLQLPTGGSMPSRLPGWQDLSRQQCRICSYMSSTAFETRNIWNTTNSFHDML
jgi:hypothetical protein